jgi:hypothetical protein
VLVLLVAAPLVSVLGDTPAAVIPGVLLFTMTTAMTLKGLHHVLPDRPGLAFGLPTFALFLGALPGLLGHRLLDGWIPVAAATGVAVVLIAAGLKQVVRAGGALGPADEDVSTT